VLRVAFLAAAIGLAACSPSETKPEPVKEGADAFTPGNPFFGTWEMTNAKIAPWWDQNGEEPAADPAMVKFVFHADASLGPPLLTCDKPHYLVNLAPERALFQGNLPDPAQDAPALGFTSPDITVLSFSCATGDADVLVDFPMINDDTIMTGLDNVLYTFRRTGD
jgi:hypothetical protein